jgi:hypothetical protein
VVEMVEVVVVQVGETGEKANVRVVHSKAAATKICTVRIMVAVLLWDG